MYLYLFVTLIVLATALIYYALRRKVEAKREVVEQAQLYAHPLHSGLEEGEIFLARDGVGPKATIKRTSSDIVIIDDPHLSREEVDAMREQWGAPASKFAEWYEVGDDGPWCNAFAPILEEALRSPESVRRYAAAQGRPYDWATEDAAA